jgi:hypothetical protein
MSSQHRRLVIYFNTRLLRNLLSAGTHLAIIILFQLLISNSFIVKANFDVKTYYEQNKQQSKEVFIQNFPYDDYLKNTSFTDFNALQQDRYFLYQQFGDGDDFLYYLGERFINTYPVKSSTAELNEKITIGEAYLNPKKSANPGIDQIYQIIGYFILGKVAQKIEEEIRKQRFDTNDQNNIALIKRLENNKVFISQEQSTGTKIFTHIWQRDFSYLLKRLLIKINERSQTVKRTAWTVLIVSIILLIILVKVKWKKLGCLVFLMAMGAVGLLIIVKLNRTPQLISKPTVTANLDLQLYQNYYPINGGKDYAVKIFKLRDRNGIEVGQAIWLQRPYLKANYFAYKNVPQKYHEFSSKNKVVLTTSGGFTNNFLQPEGFTTENGSIVNAVIMHDRHGLVMVKPDGGINVLNLRKESFLLPQGQTIENPLNSLISYSKLLQWCQANHATIFQTQLLAFSNNLTINREKAKPQLRERRILALVSDPQTNEVHHVLFNFPNQQNLADISKEVFDILASRGKKIEAVLNLDVGAYNILNIFDDNGNVLNDIKGPVEVDRATNLIVYSK